MLFALTVEHFCSMSAALAFNSEVGVFWTSWKGIRCHCEDLQNCLHNYYSHWPVWRSAIYSAVCVVPGLQAWHFNAWLCVQMNGKPVKHVRLNGNLQVACGGKKCCFEVAQVQGCGFNLGHGDCFEDGGEKQKLPCWDFGAWVPGG